MGTHLTLFGTSGALEASITDAADRTIWICSSHSETRAATHALSKLATNQIITVLSGGYDQGGGIIMGFTGALITHNTASSGNGSRLRFDGVGFSVSTSFTADFITGGGGFDLPEIEMEDCKFYGAGTWQYLYLHTTGSADLFGFWLNRLNGNFTALVNLNSSAAALSGPFVLTNSDLTLTNLFLRGGGTNNEAGDRYEIRDNRLILSSYLMQITYSTTTPVLIENNYFDHNGNQDFIDLGTGSTTNVRDAAINGNIYDAIGGGSSTRFVDITPAAGAAEAISIVGNVLIGPWTPT